MEWVSYHEHALDFGNKLPVFVISDINATTHVTTISVALSIEGLCRLHSVKNLCFRHSLLRHFCDFEFFSLADKLFIVIFVDLCIFSVSLGLVQSLSQYSEN